MVKKIIEKKVEISFKSICYGRDVKKKKFDDIQLRLNESADTYPGLTTFSSYFS